MTRATRRERILAYLAEHPGRSAWEIGRVVGSPGSLYSLLHDMAAKAQVISQSEWRPRQGRHVLAWSLAPPGTVPPPADDDARRRKRQLDRESLRRRRARSRGLAIAPGAAAPLIRRQAHLRPAAAGPLPPGAACRDADPALFFPEPGADDSQAKAICARCPVRRQCYDRARANGEAWGIWGGVNFGEPAQRKARAS